MGWKISDKPTVDPKDTDLVLIEQDGNTRNTTWAKLKAFFLGTATLATTDQTIKGAINEVKASTDANATSLSDNTNKIGDLSTNKVNGVCNIYTSANISKLGLTLPVTCTQLAEVLANGDIFIGFESTISDAPATYGSLFVRRIDTNRVEFEFRGLYNSGIYIASYRSASVPKFSGWKQLATIDDSGWITLPLDSGITVDGGLTPQYRKIGKQVFIVGSVLGITGANQRVGVLPVGFRPSKNAYYVNHKNGLDSINRFSINTWGEIIIQNNTKGTFNATDYNTINTSFCID